MQIHTIWFILLILPVTWSLLASERYRGQRNEEIKASFQTDVSPKHIKRYGQKQ